MKTGAVLALVAGLALGVGATRWYGGEAQPAAAGYAGGSVSGTSMGQAAAEKTLAERVAALEAALAESTDTQLDLFNQLLHLEGLLEDQLAQPVRPAADTRQLARSGSDNATPRPRYSRDPDQRRREQLLNYGFDEATVARITEREGQLRMDAMRRRYEARRGDSEQPVGPTVSYRQQLREELGDDLYDRYLYATGRSNRVTVSGVVSTSPAEQAGLKRGDMILSYDGERVFGMNDIIRLSHQGEMGGSVSLEVQKADGRRETLYLPRGPLGMWGGGRKRVDPNN